MQESEVRINSGGSIRGEFSPPADKSISHRAVMIGSVSSGITRISNFLSSEDCLSTKRVFEAMGVQMEFLAGGTLAVHGMGKKGLSAPSVTLDAGNSGTTMRLSSGILAAQDFSSRIDGDSSLRSRPMDRIIGPLRSMGADIKGIDDRLPPLEISGRPLKGIRYEMPVPSAQVKSCILFAGLYAGSPSTIIEKIPSRDHTERMLIYFGAPVDINGKEITINAFSGDMTGKEIRVPGDVSSAAFLIAAAVLLKGSQLLVKDVGCNNTRTGFIDTLIKMGAHIKILNKREWNNEPVADIEVRSSELSGIEISGDQIPSLIDEIPILAVLATQASGRSIIKDARELRVKETDRLYAISSQLSRLGANIEVLEDGMIIDGPATLSGRRLKSFGDHRIAMALAVAGLLAGKESLIQGTDCVDISFPGFFEILGRLRDE